MKILPVALVLLLVFSSSIIISYGQVETSVLTMSGKDWSFKVLTGGLEKQAYTVSDSKGTDLRYVFSTLEEAQKYEGKITFPVSVQGLDCYYQDELTEEENKTSFRPIDVVHSYACYDKTGNKVMHIYRSALLDSDGIKVWCDMKLDSKLGLLSVLWDVKDLDKLVFPVVLDPTFGYTTIGGSDADDGGYYVASKFTLSDAGDVSELSLYLSSDDRNVVTYIFKDVEGEPDSSPNITSNTVAVSSTQQWWNFTVSGSLDAGDYWLGFRTSGGHGNWKYDSGASAHYSVSSSPPLTWADYGDRKMSIYVTYTAGGDTYVLTNNIATPENTTYTTSSVLWSVSNSGNATSVSYQIGLWNGSTQVVSNWTTSTGQMTGLVNGTSYKFCVTATGDESTYDYDTIMFSVAIPSAATDLDNMVAIVLLAIGFTFSMFLILIKRG